MKNRLLIEVETALRVADFEDEYASEGDFERAVWSILGPLAQERDWKMLSSHKSLDLPGRSQAAWDEFLRGDRGPDVVVFGQRNRVDIVVASGDATLGIEIERSAGAKAAEQLVHGLGQAVLALNNRDCSMLVIHCSAGLAEHLAGALETVDNLNRQMGSAVDDRRFSVVMVSGRRSV